MSTYRPNAKTLPFVLLALLGILYIYDAGVEQEIVSPEIISETLLLPKQNTAKIQTMQKKPKAVKEKVSLMVARLILKVQVKNLVLLSEARVP